MLAQVLKYFLNIPLLEKALLICSSLPKYEIYYTFRARTSLQAPVPNCVTFFGFVAFPLIASLSPGGELQDITACIHGKNKHQTQLQLTLGTIDYATAKYRFVLLTTVDIKGERKENGLQNRDRRRETNKKLRLAASRDLAVCHIQQLHVDMCLIFYSDGCNATRQKRYSKHGQIRPVDVARLFCLCKLFDSK